MAHTYFLMKLPGEPDKVLVWDTRTLTVGRAEESALVLADPDVSRRHAIFTKDGDRCDVGDHQTGNGTFVNGEGVTGTQPIHHGDLITIGKLQLELCITDEHPAKRGMKLEYASHLMTGGMVPGGGNPDSTMVGIGSSEDDDPFVIEHNDGTGSDLFGDDALELDLLAPASVKDLDSAMSADTGATVPAAAGPAAPVVQPAAPVVQPAAPAADPNDSQMDPIERMRQLKGLHAEGLITDDEFQQKRAQILKDV